MALASTAVAATPLTQVAGSPAPGKDVPISVSEVMKHGQLRPCPDAGWNSWGDLKPLSLGDHFICVQSVTVDPRGLFRVIDPAAPGNEFIKPGGRKADEDRPQDGQGGAGYPVRSERGATGSWMNGVRVSPDGRYAFLTEEFGQTGALVVVDIAAKACRVLDADPRTQPEHGIALDAAGKYLYWRRRSGLRHRLANSGHGAASREGQHPKGGGLYT